MKKQSIQGTPEKTLSFDDFRKEILADYKLASLSREASLMGRKEVLTGKAKFGIFGDGKEVAQIAMAKVFQNGDFRSGYYRDQTFALATGIATLEQLFSQLYADDNIEREPHSGGRMMNAHFATRLIDENGEWKNHTESKNTSADASPTASQMPRALGLALASKMYRESPALKNENQFSINGNEVAFATIGDSSTSEGHFWETLNAAGVLKVPLAISVWDDGFGISVPQKYQTTKENISEIVSGFQTDENGNGIDIYTVNGWDYPALMETYTKAIAKTRDTHIPCLIHVKELTQPQGHSTSGSHERYKTKERLEWEKDFDCNKKMREWIIKTAIASTDELDEIENESKREVRDAARHALKDFNQPLKEERDELSELLEEVAAQSEFAEIILQKKEELVKMPDAIRKDALITAREILLLTRNENPSVRQQLVDWKNNYLARCNRIYTSQLTSESKHAALKVAEVKPVYDENAIYVNGFEVLNAFFDYALSNNNQLIAFGEDVGRIGDVNQGFAGLQAKHGEHRVFDTGIREATIIGQGIGMAMRGLRPIAEIQYLDYLLYALQPLSDDLATLLYRSAGGQKAPLIIRTRGHRFEGIWHTGSPIGMILNSIRGINFCVPRNMTQAAGFYNTLLQSDEPALVIECLNGYRLKERLPSNIGKFTVPLGVPEVIREGDDITIVTYGSCCRIAEEAAEKAALVGISVEIVDVQTLLPFDLHNGIVESIKKTNRVIFLDEDVPGGASAFMMQKVLEEQNALQHLDSLPKTITAKENRGAYASDGNYFCKPNAEDVFETVYAIMRESNPNSFPEIG
ncbi:MAG: transketolase [Sphingobacteriales bacterium]|nr:MAG: transketolase [Sphingobacteriales bacterium]